MKRINEDGRSSKQRIFPSLRRINIFVVIGIVLSFLFHSISGSIRLFGAEGISPKLSARLCLTFAAVHVIITAILTVKTLMTIRKSGRGYFRENIIFWTRRISGFALLIPLVMHLLIFRGTGDDAYRLVFFHSGRLVSQILLAACLALHIIMNIRPMLIGMGAKQRGLLSADICFVLSVVLLLCCCAFCAYFLRWAAF